MNHPTLILGCLLVLVPLVVLAVGALVVLMVVLV